MRRARQPACDPVYVQSERASTTSACSLGKDGRLKGKIRIKDGDESTFVAERAEEPDEPIQEPPSYQDKWRRTRAVVHELSSSIPPRRRHIGWPLLRLAP